METNGFRIAILQTAYVGVLIDDNDVEGSKRRDGGEDGFEEIRCDILLFTKVGPGDRFRCGLQRSEGFVLRQIEMLKLGVVLRYKFRT